MRGRGESRGGGELYRTMAESGKFKRSPGELLYLQHFLEDAHETLLEEVGEHGPGRSMLVLGMLYYDDICEYSSVGTDSRDEVDAMIL